MHPDQRKAELPALVPEAENQEAVFDMIFAAPSRFPDCCNFNFRMAKDIASFERGVCRLFQSHKKT